MGIRIRSERCFECGTKISSKNSFSCNECAEDLCLDCLGNRVEGNENCHNHEEDLYHGGVREEK